MDLTLSIEKMTITEKLYTMEKIWDELRLNAKTMQTPAWHKDVLKKREKDIAAGIDNLIDWDEAKDNIRQTTS